jgi:ribosomal protein S6--L-glutamate ligase
LSSTPRIITNNNELLAAYHELQAGDIVTCRLRLRTGEEHLLLDLLERGIQLIPSATSQLASRSKTFQARLFAPLMIHHTTVIYNIHGLLYAISLYGKNSIKKVIFKHDRKNAGFGIHLFRDIEDVYTQAANNVLAYPFVLQPFIKNSRDIRVIIIDDFIEAYERDNPDNFRNNLHCGGNATPYTLSTEQLELCKTAMERGSFPYAHLDLMITEKEETFLAEINLRGGMRGATIDTDTYQAKIEKCKGQLFNRQAEWLTNIP